MTVERRDEDHAFSAPHLDRAIFRPAGDAVPALMNAVYWFRVSLHAVVSIPRAMTTK